MHVPKIKTSATMTAADADAFRKAMATMMRPGIGPRTPKIRPIKGKPA